MDVRDFGMDNFNLDDIGRDSRIDDSVSEQAAEREVLDAIASETDEERARRLNAQAKAEGVLAEGWALLNEIEPDPRYQWSGVEVLMACIAMSASRAQADASEGDWAQSIADPFRSALTHRRLGHPGKLPFTERDEDGNEQ